MEFNVLDSLNACMIRPVSLYALSVHLSAVQWNPRNLVLDSKK